MDSTSSLRHRFLALHVLYWSSVLVLLPFAILFAFLQRHGWDHLKTLFVLMPLAVGCVLLMWSILEPLLEQRRDRRTNTEPIASQTFERLAPKIENRARAPVTIFNHTTLHTS